MTKTDRRELHQLMDNSTVIIASLACTIRDGIERNYGSWNEWQWIAREILKDLVPDVYRDLDRYEDVIAVMEREVAK